VREEFSLAVIEGHLETDNDARRIRAKGVPAVHDALHEMPWMGSTSCSSGTWATWCARRVSTCASSATSRCSR
jgi:hypothetical protein